VSAPGEIARLLELLDEGYDAKAWHGPNLRGSVRRLAPEEASWRPGPRRHNIWEIAIHAAYWKYTVRRRIAGLTRGSFALAGSNWFRRPIEGRSWREDLALLDEEHERLRQAVAALPASRLAQGVKRPGTGPTLSKTISGVALHDVYHAGQIRLIQTFRKGA
jgi:hypothetical protein